jgi:uncharacterized protein YxjI
MAVTAYRMRESMFTIGDDFLIQGPPGMPTYKVDGKALRVRNTLLLETPDGRELYKIQERKLRIKDTMDIEGPNGVVASVKKALITPLRERFTVDMAGGQSWEIQGNLVDHEYEISGPSGRVATVSKRWFRVRDTYGIEVGPGQDVPLVLMAAVAVDQMAHN